jgi:hypothetical protein
MHLIELGPEARRYIEERLVVGGTLSRLLLARLPASLRAITELPEGSALDRVSDLRSGGKTPSLLSIKPADGPRMTRVESALQGLAARVARHLASNPGAFLVLENRLATRGDAWLERLAGPMKTYSNEVYHLLGQETGSATLVAEAFGAAFRPPGCTGALGVLSSEESQALLQEGQLSTDDLRRIASATQALVVDAFDGESFVLAELSQTESWESREPLTTACREGTPCD